MYTGEELCISYIEEDAPFTERQDALRDYGFVCDCVKCQLGAAGDAEDEAQDDPLAGDDDD